MIDKQVPPAENEIQLYSMYAEYLSGEYEIIEATPEEMMRIAMHCLKYKGAHLVIIKPMKE